MKILVADDDQDLLSLLRFSLNQAGYEVVAANDGPSAIQAFATERPDLALLDVNMPGATGLQVCRAIRESSMIPVMMLTVRNQEQDLVNALELGAYDYVTKPF
jgi:DNA-binding response OmpR family regulator